MYSEDLPAASCTVWPGTSPFPSPTRHIGPLNLPQSCNCRMAAAKRAMDRHDAMTSAATIARPRLSAEARPPGTRGRKTGPRKRSCGDGDACSTREAITSSPSPSAPPGSSVSPYLLSLIADRRHGALEPVVYGRAAILQRRARAMMQSKNPKK